MCVEVCAQVQEGLGKEVLLNQVEDSKEASETAVPVEEGVDRLELLEVETAAHECRESHILVEKSLEVIEQRAYLLGERRDERGVVRRLGWRTVPGRRRPEFSRAPLLTPHTLHEDGVDITDQARQAPPSETCPNQSSSTSGSKFPVFSVLSNGSSESNPPQGIRRSREGASQAGGRRSQRLLRAGEAPHTNAQCKVCTEASRATELGGPGRRVGETAVDRGAEPCNPVLRILRGFIM